MSHYLIAGGAGFLGSHLVKRLYDQGNKITVVDNLCTGNMENIRNYHEKDYFQLYIHDINNLTSTTDLGSARFDGIFNLACPASPIHYQNIPIETTLTCVVGTNNLLKLAKEHECKIIQASTSEVYGDPEISPQHEYYVGHVNSYGPRACYSSDTEILTKDGWKFFQDIKKEDFFLTIDKNSKIIYQQASEIISQNYTGNMIQFISQNAELLVTPNHKMYVKKRDHDDFELLEASNEISWERAKMLKTADYDADDITEFKFVYNDSERINAKKEFIESVNMDDWVEFFGYFITEGCVYSRKGGYGVYIAQSKDKNPENYEKIWKCLQRLPFEFKEPHKSSHQFYCLNKQLYIYLKQFGKSKDKFIPQELKNLSRRQLEILYSAMMIGDGSKRGNIYYSNSKASIDDFQEILMKIGIVGNIGQNPDSRKENPVYSISVFECDEAQYRKKEVVNYNGTVHCVTVPNRIVYVRRNGKALFCGNCYDEGKRAAEALFYDYKRIHKVKTRIIRIFNTYGPNMSINDGRVVSNFIVQALNNEDITIYGDGSQTRSFCYVDDLIDGMLTVFGSSIDTPVNVGNPKEFTMIELAQKVIKITGSKSRITFLPLPQDDPKQRRPDIGLINSLGWNPKITLDNGLLNTVKYFSGKLKEL